MKKSLPALIRLVLCHLILPLPIVEWGGGGSLQEYTKPFGASTARGQESAPGQLLPAAGTGSGDPNAAGNELLRLASGQLERRGSVSARLRHQLAIFGQQLYGVGSYWQQGVGEDLKIRLELQIAGQEARLLQVCNSRFMWRDTTLPTGRSIKRLDLRQLRADPTLSGESLSEIKPGQASWSTLDANLIALTGGLPAMLTSLGTSFDFMPPQPMRLAIAPPLADEPTSVPVFAIVGHWKPDRLAAMLARASEKSNTSSIPERIPEEVLLLVGQTDLFPYRIEYRRQETPKLSHVGAVAIPYQLSAHPMVVLEFSDVVFDGTITPGLFDYAPGNVEWSDQTTAILERLRRQQKPQLATRPEAPALK